VPKSAAVLVGPAVDPELEFELEDETIVPFVGLVGIVTLHQLHCEGQSTPANIINRTEAEELATLKGCVLVTAAERLYIYLAPVL